MEIQSWNAHEIHKYKEEKKNQMGKMKNVLYLICAVTTQYASDLFALQYAVTTNAEPTIHANAASKCEKSSSFFFPCQTAFAKHEATDEHEKEWNETGRK